MTPLRLLLVEDAPTDAKLVIQALRRAGREVDALRVDTEAALREALETSTWDVVLSDWTLPTFSGARALAMVADLGLDLPFIIVSGSVGEERAVAAMRAGAHDYVLKDNLSRLAPAVEREMREHARRRLGAEVAVALSGAGTLREMLQRCCEALNERLGAALSRIWTVDRAGDVLELQGSAGLYTRIDGSRARVRLDDRVVGCIASHGAPRVVDDRSGESWVDDPAWARREGLRAFAGHPLLVGGQLVGVVASFFREPPPDAVLATLASVADVIAIRVRGVVAEGERASLQEQLRQAQKLDAVGRLAGGVAHDFNNLLSVILGNAELVLDELGPDASARESIEEIRTAGLRASDLTKQLLTFSRQQVFEPQILDLATVLAGLDRILRRLVGEDIELTTLARRGLGYVRMDPSSLEQVVMNLVVNARDAIVEGGKITLEAEDVELDEAYARTHLGAKPGSYVMMSVSDTGSGMDRATLARVFEPFFTTKEEGKGTGLGLSIVFGVVKQSGGSIWGYSEPGVGTTFKLYFPRADGPLGARSLPPRPQALRGSETVLLVEDEEQVRHVAEGILRRHGYVVLPAAGADEAVLLCERHPTVIDLLLTDVVMPRMSGPALAKHLGTMRPDMRVLLMSGYTNDAAVRHGVVAGELAYVQKPLTVERLTSKVREVLDAKRT